MSSPRAPPNTRAAPAGWRACGIDSVFLPGTQKHEIARLGFKYVMKNPKEDPEKRRQAAASPLQLLDYRCHTPGGRIGTGYTPQVRAGAWARGGATSWVLAAWSRWGHVKGAPLQPP